MNNPLNLSEPALLTAAVQDCCRDFRDLSQEFAVGNLFGLVTAYAVQWLPNHSHEQRIVQALDHLAAYCPDSDAAVFAVLGRQVKMHAECRADAARELERNGR